MRIQDLELKSGLDRATIRYYEKLEMITPVRHENGYRDYSDEDLQQLLKIKLLRQLGMPLVKIKQLQAGDADFQTAIKEQIKQLEAKRDAAQRSAQVCMQIQTAGVTYATLNASYYLEQFRITKPQYPQSAPVPKVSATFRERIPMEYHPFRHYFARTVDMLLFAMLTLFVQAAFFRARSDVFSMPHILALLLWIPLEAACYTLFAATPGKLAFGIRVHHADGRKLSYSCAIERAFGVYRYGLGWGIPIWELWRGYKSYKQHNDGEELEWNHDCEITYFDFDDWKEKSKPIIVITILIALLISTFSLLISPKYGNSDLNIEQFSANYNEYSNLLKVNCRKLNPDGTFVEYSGNSVVISIGSEVTFDDFQYTLENGAIKAINYEETHEKIFFIAGLPNKCTIASIALLGAQKGESLSSIDTFIEELNQKIEDAMKNGKRSLTFDYGPIRIHWKIDYKNCTVVSTGSNKTMLKSKTEENNGTAKIQFKIELIDQATQ